MRVPYDVIRDGLGAINLAAEAMGDAQRQVSTGRRITRAGDDPLGTQQAVAEHANLSSADAYSRTRDGAASRLASADALFASFGDKLAAVIVAGLGAQGSHVTASARAAAADAVLGLRDSLLADINTNINGVAIFGGTATTSTPYALVGGTWTYQGNNDVAKVEVERGRLVSVTFDGQAIVQGTDTVDVFSALDGLAQAITAGNDPAIQAGIQAVERALDRTLRAQGGLGADERGLDDAAIRLAAMRRAANTRRSSLEDANMAEAIVRMTDAETAYRAALGSVSTVERTSLLDYLR